MIIPKNDDGKALNLEIVELAGGPHHGERLNVPVDEFLLVLKDRGKPCRYHRIGSKPVFRCEDTIIGAFGGRQR